MKNREAQRLIWPEALKIAALFAVILIHSAAPLLLRYHSMGAEVWWIGNLYDSLARWCIPVFVMLSGSFLIDRADGKHWNQFIVRRMRRVVIPLIFWSALYFIWRREVNGENLDPGDFFALVLAEPAYYHLWFLYMLIGLYVIAPLLNAFMRRASTSMLFYFFALWVLFGSLLPTAQRLFGFRIYDPLGNATPLFVYMGYFSIGRALRDLLPGPRLRLLAAGTFLLAYAATALGTYYRSIVRNGGELDPVFYEYGSISVVLMSLGVFLMFKGDGKPVHPRHFRRKELVLLKIAQCMPGVYLLHAMVIAVLAQGMTGITFTQLSLPPVIGVPAFAFTTFTVSLCVILVLRDVPVIRWVVP